MLEVHLIYSIALRPIIVKKLLEISVQVYHDRFFVAKKYYLFWFSLDCINIVGHLHFSIQGQNGLLIKQHRIVDSVGIVFKIKVLNKCLKS